MQLAHGREHLREAAEAVNRAENRLGHAKRECSGGLCLWHRFSPMQMGEIGNELIDARYAIEAAIRTLREEPAGD